MRVGGEQKTKGSDDAGEKKGLSRLAQRARQGVATLGRRQAAELQQHIAQNPPQEGTPLFFDPTAESRETVDGRGSHSAATPGDRIRTPRPGLAGKLMRVIAQKKSDLSEGINKALLDGDISPFISQLSRVDSEELTATLKFLEMWERQSLYEMVSALPSDQRTEHTAGALRILKEITHPGAALLPELNEQLAVVMENHTRESHLILYQRLREQIARALPEGDDKDYDLAVVSMIAGLLKRHPQSRDIIAGFLSARPPRELMAMFSLIDPVRCRQADYAGFRELAMQCIDGHREGALRRFVPTAGHLHTLNSARDPATGALKNPHAFAEAVIACDRNLSLHSAYGGNQDLSPYLDDIRRELEPLSLAVNLDELDMPTLRQLGEAVDRFGDGGPWSSTTGQAISGAIRQAIPVRRQKDIDAHKAIATSVITSLKQAGAQFGVGVLVRTIKTAIVDHLDSPAGPAGDRTADQTVTILITELTTVVREMPPGERLALAKSMNAPTLRELRAALHMLELMAPDAGNRAMLTELHQIAAILDAIGQAAGRISDADKSAPVESFASLHSDVRKALEMCGIGMSGGGVVYFTTELRTAVEQCLTARPIAPASKRGIQHVPTTAYNIVGVGSGASIPDLRERLNVLCRNDPHLLQALGDPAFLARLQGATSQVMHAMAQALFSSGIRTIEGTPIDLHGDLAAGFSFEFHPKLGLVVKCGLQLSGPYGLTGDPENPDPVRLGGNAKIEFDFAFGADGIARMVRPPALTNNIQVVPSWAKDPKPRGVDDLMQPGAPAAIRRAYYDYVLKNHSEEPYEYIEAVDALPEDDAQALIEVRRAGGIADTFIRPGAEKFVNVADAMIQRVLAAIDDPNPDMQTIRSRLRELRAGAVDLTSRDTFQRFALSEQLKTAVDDAVKDMASKEDSPRNARAKAKTPSTEMERSALADLVPVEVAKRQADLAKKRPQDINSSLLILANLSAPKHTVDKNAETLLARKGDPFANLDEFQAHVSAFLIAHMQQPFALASLRYNLERVVSDEMRNDPRIKAALAATKDAQARSAGAGAGFALMSAEAILLQHAPPGLHSSYVAIWFRDNRVSEASIAEFFKKIPDSRKLQAKLNAIAALPDREARQEVRDRLVEIGQRELGARGARTQTVPRVAPRPPRRAVQDPDWFNKSGDVLRQGADIWLLNKRLAGSNLLPGDLPILGALARKLDTEDLGTRSDEIREMVRGLASIKSTEWEPLQEAWLSELLDIFAPPPTPPEPSSPATAGAEFIRIVQGWDFEARLLPQHAQALATLATLFEELKPQPTSQGLVFAADVPPGTMEAYVLLHERLEAQLEEFRGEGWQPEESRQLKSVLDSLETLKLNTRAVQVVHRAFTAPAT